MKNFDYVKINSLNPLYIIANQADGSNEEKNGIKYLTFASTDKTKKVLEKYTKLGDDNYHIKTINGGESGEYGKDFIKI